MNDAEFTPATGPARGREALIRAALVMQRSLTVLPWSVQRVLGRALGAASFRLAGRRRRVAERNLALCFSELTAGERRQLLRRHFRSLGLGLMELGLAWWASDRRLRSMATVEGLEHLEAARAGGRPVILVAGHFTTMDLACRLLGLSVDYDGIQRPFGYPALDRHLTRGRLRAASRVYSKFDLRGILDALARGRTLWMAVDQAHTSARPVVAPFFGLPAPTTGSPARLAARSGAAVLPVAGWREPDGRYRVVVEPALADFPTGDDSTDATRLNAVVERHARAAPEQYYWIHRRFKGDPSPYEEP
jgi:KDO2-lipid IV(A) lauroyltransferase